MTGRRARDGPLPYWTRPPATRPTPPPRAARPSGRRLGGRRLRFLLQQPLDQVGDPRLQDRVPEPGRVADDPLPVHHDHSGARVVQIVRRGLVQAPPVRPEAVLRLRDREGAGHLHEVQEVRAVVLRLRQRRRGRRVRVEAARPRPERDVQPQVPEPGLDPPRRIDQRATADAAPGRRQDEGHPPGRGAVRPVAPTLYQNCASSGAAVRSTFP